MERDTIAIYERSATEYRRHRRPVYADRAERFASGAPRALPILDAGCGAGIYLAHLAASGHRVVGLDAAAAMLDLAAEAPAQAGLVRGDLEALPFASSCFGAAWARNTYLHVRRDRLPLALADLHRVLAPHGQAWISLLVDGGEDGVLADGDLPGRFFSRWSLPLLADVLSGAGFAVEQVDQPEATWFLLRRRDAVPNLLAAEQDVAVCTLRAGASFVTADDRIGKACIINDREPIAGKSLTDAVLRLTRVLQWLAPRQVIFVGQADWTLLSETAPGSIEGFAELPISVVPSPSEA